MEEASVSSQWRHNECEADRTGERGRHQRQGISDTQWLEDRFRNGIEEREKNYEYPDMNIRKGLLAAAKARYGDLGKRRVAQELYGYGVPEALPQRNRDSGGDAEGGRAGGETCEEWVNWVKSE